LPVSKDQVLLDRYTVRYVPSAALAQHSHECKRKQALGIAGAAEHEASAKLELDAMHLAFPAARRFEGDAIEWHDIAKSMESSDWVHCATHAELHPRDPRLISFALGRRNVTLAEVANLKLQDACVVLSACSTAVGQQTGSDVFSLARSCLGAGATTLVTSLWPVADAAIVQLMQVFYKKLSVGLTAAQSLRDAQLALRNQYKHPAIWSPMIILGTDVRLIA
jgi:CHAT domain-containing protein